MKYTYWQYKNNKVSGLEYVKDHYIGDGDGEVMEISIRKDRKIYAIKRKLKDYDDIDYCEYKIYDIDAENNACVDKKIQYRSGKSKFMTLKEYWKRLKSDPEMKNWIDCRIEFGD